MSACRYSPVFNRFFEIIRRTRKLKHLTIRQLAAVSGVSVATISRIERGQGTIFLTVIEKVLYALECDIYDLLVMAKREVQRETRKALEPRKAA